MCTRNAWNSTTKVSWSWICICAEAVASKTEKNVLVKCVINAPYHLDYTLSLRDYRAAVVGQMFYEFDKCLPYS